LVPICLYCLNCTKFGQLILRKIIKIVATRCPILRLKCTKFDFGWGSAPDPAGGAYSTPQIPWLELMGLLLTGREGGREEKGGDGRNRETTGGEGAKGKLKRRGKGKDGGRRRSPKEKFTTTPLYLHATNSRLEAVQGVKEIQYEEPAQQTQE